MTSGIKKESDALRRDAERWRASRTQLPQDGSRGQRDAWADLRIRLEQAERVIEQECCRCRCEPNGPLIRECDFHREQREAKAKAEAALEAWQSTPMCESCRAVIEARAGGVECTGAAASWCPIHGDCTCEDRERTGDMDNPQCPLHGSCSEHSRAGEDRDA